MSRSYLYIERSSQEVLLSGSAAELEKIQQASLNILSAGKAAVISKEHFKSMQRAWKREGNKPIHSAIGKTIVIPNLDFESGENSLHLFMDLTKLAIIQDGGPQTAIEAAA